MRHLLIAAFLACVACSKQPLASDAGEANAPPSSPTDPTPSNSRTVHCKSADGSWKVDLRMIGSEHQPRSAYVHLGSDAAPETSGVSGPGGFPPPNQLTCNKSDDPNYVGCYVAGTNDYGYIANVRLDASGKRTMELRKNGIASSFLANLDCDG